MSTQWARQKLQNIDMHPALFETIAQIIDEIGSHAYLGNATNQELFQELHTRISVHWDINYRVTNYDK